ncbi:MAG: bifunctional adenosylcobinamide hydrolase/alpha-ribazole phosphatase CbiS [Methanomassiliicoccaceae archaeon]|nr:bifunctional adenosylcobinamide hydrolase/alpha-ribazole phosphatase CbiS [Methanomassiliicoccaceae archaeon]MCL2145597.1 bifunctional adenosylcobinamide hydrolase/alpha-ribazole phosphatase CbiS [Methanomassiliicoccaceae archaeon]
MRYVKDVKIFEDGDMATAVVYLTERMEVLSSAVTNSGHTVTDTLFIMQVPHHYVTDDPLPDVKRTMEKHKIPEHAVGFMTAAEVKYVFSTVETDHEGYETFAAVTAGLSNHVVAGELLENWEERFRISQERYRMLVGGTINIIGISPVPLTDAAKVNIMMPMIEAKSAAMGILGYRETGTTSDAIAIVSPAGDEKEKYAGTGVPLGISMARSVKAAVISNLVKRGDFPYMGTFLDVLKGRGITKELMWEAALELYIPNPAWDTDDLERRFGSKLDILSSDINISSLIQGAVALEDIGTKDCICAMPRGMFAEDPIHLIADEIIGMQIAQYIAGTRGVFEFHRFDRHKPGVISKLGPFMDDMLCGLIGGVMSSVYTDMFDEQF